MRLHSHAKINLSLEITGKRPDGYHEISSFMQGTGLYDVVEIKKCSENRTKFCLPHCTINDLDVYLCTETDAIPVDERNLAIKAVKVFTDAYEIRRAGPILIEIDKRLPVAAGIAGGSGNAAVCLLGLNELSGRPFTLRQLMDIGVRAGADVPFSIFMNAYRNREALSGLEGLDEASDAAVVSGIGETVIRAESIPRHVILANPGVAVSTKSVYEAMDAIGFSDAASAGKRLFVNDMEKHTLVIEPKAAALKKYMTEKLAADEVLMSGSGPTIAAYYKDDKKASTDMALMTELTAKDASVRAWLTDTGK